MRVLISDKLSESGLAIFKKAKGIEVDYQPGLGKDIPKLKKAIATADAIAIRSGTTLTADIINIAKNLKVIGRAGIGVDNVDIPAASKKGIIVMNTPGGNTITTAEHAIAMMCSVARQIPQATASIKKGKWEKGKFLGIELYQKTLGVIGLGNIGKIVADRAQGLKMKVIAYDPFITDEVARQLGIVKLPLDELYKEADFITIHVPKNEKTTQMINRQAFAKMKRGVCLINCARGGIVSEKDLKDAIDEGIVAGAALDVFETEPVDTNNPLLHLSQVITTPHLGAATGEAQENVALDVAKQIVAYLIDGTIQNSINVPSVSGEILKVLQPYLSVSEKIGKLHGQLANECPKDVSIEYCGEVTKLPTQPLTVCILRGILEPVLSDVTVNAVNAPVIANERGIKVNETTSSDHHDFSSLITVTLTFKKGEKIIAGTIFGKTHPRIVRFDRYYLEVVPEGNILIICNEDKPGVVGNIGTLLGKRNINISRLQLGLSPKSKLATAFYSVEGKVANSVIGEIKKLPGIISVQQVVL